MKRLHSSLSPIFLWFRLWTKRLFLHPFFLFTLFLLPAATLFISRSDFSGDAILRIALCIDGSTPDFAAKNLRNELIQLSNHTVEFYPVSSTKKVYTDVSDGKAVSGYIFPADLEQKLSQYAAEKKPFIVTVQHDAEMSNKLVNEIVLSKLYKTHAWWILLDFISDKISKKKDLHLDLTFLKERIETYQTHELLFQFEYADGGENTFLNEPSGILLMPLRGMISILIFLSCMAGALTWYEDKENSLSLILPGKKKVLCMIFSLLVPALYAGILGIFSLKMTEISESLLKEGLSMLCFLFACISLNFFLLSLLKQKEIFLSLLPGITIGSLLLCPVFIDLSIYSPAIKILRYLFPMHYYLRSLHSVSDLWYLLLYGMFLLCFTKFLPRSTTY